MTPPALVSATGDNLQITNNGPVAPFYSYVGDGIVLNIDYPNGNDVPFLGFDFLGTATPSRFEIDLLGTEWSLD